jgi:hypothetical protein
LAAGRAQIAQRGVTMQAGFGGWPTLAGRLRGAAVCIAAVGRCPATGQGQLSIASALSGGSSGRVVRAATATSQAHALYITRKPAASAHLLPLAGLFKRPAAEAARPPEGGTPPPAPPGFPPCCCTCHRSCRTCNGGVTGARPHAVAETDWQGWLLSKQQLCGGDVRPQALARSRDLPLSR